MKTHYFAPPRVINGCWQLAGGHGELGRREIFEVLFESLRRDLGTFDCADIYTGVESILGEFRERVKAEAPELLPRLSVHTKFVPDYSELRTLSHEYVERIIDRSRARLRVDSLDLVQFHWWDLSIPGYVETALELNRLREKGKIQAIGLTNFDTLQVEEIITAGVPIASNQIQFSLLDARPETAMLESARAHGYKLLCYGSLAGGFLHERYIDSSEPREPLENRSLVKYKLIIEECGGWEWFQTLLRRLQREANTFELSISEFAALYPIHFGEVASIIVGQRGKRHIESNRKLAQANITSAMSAAFRRIRQDFPGFTGRVYEAERDKDGPHGRIMRYNLNKRQTGELSRAT